MTLPEAYQGYLTLGILAVVIILLIRDKLKASVVFMGAALLLLLSGILSAEEFLSNFSNKSIISIFILILITATFNNNFDIVGKLDALFGKRNGPRMFLLKMTGAVSVLSSVMNNTPIVALMIPYVYNRGKKTGVSPSKYLIPLSFAAITGGMITVIGTSTNLVLNGFLELEGQPVFGLIDFVIPGLLVTIGVILFLVIFGFGLLPDKSLREEDIKAHIRKYLVEIEIAGDKNLPGRTVEEAELRNLKDLYLVEILRGNERIFPVAPETTLNRGDRLFFAGDTAMATELVNEHNDFDWSKTRKFGLGEAQELVEVIVPYNSGLANTSLKEFGFRERYDGAVVAIHRNGEEVEGKLGEIELKVGDMLLVVAGQGFKKAINSAKDLYSVSISSRKEVRLTSKKVGFLIAFFGIILLAVTGLLDPFVSLVSLLACCFGFGLLPGKEVKKNVNLDLLMVLAGALTLGNALIKTGAADYFTSPLVRWVEPYGFNTIMISIFLLTVLLTTFVTNVAAVSIIFPLAFGFSAILDPDQMRSLFLAIAFGASAAFLTPVSYQTNLMVMGPGNYTIRDFFKVGFPTLLVYSSIILGYLTLT